MAFSRSKVQRFNETSSCAPPPGTYNPKSLRQVKGAVIDKEIPRFSSSEYSDCSVLDASTISNLSSYGSLESLTPRKPAIVENKARKASGPSAELVRLRHLEAEVKRLIHERNELDSKYRKKEEDHRKLDGHLQQVQKDRSSLEAQVASMKREIASLQTSTQTARHILEDSVKKAVADAQRPLMDQQAKMESQHKREKDTWQASRTHLEAAIKQHKQQVSSLEDSAKKQQLEVDHLQKELNVSEDKDNDLVQRLTNELDAAAKKLVAATVTLQESQRELSDLQAQLKQSQQSEELLTDNIRNLTTKYQELEKDLADSEKRSAVREEDLTKDVQALQHSNNERNAKCDELQRVNSDLESRLQAEQEACRRLQTHADELQKSYDELRKSHEQQQKSHENLQMLSDNLKESHEESLHNLEQVCSQLGTEKSNNEQLRSQVETLTCDMLTINACMEGKMADMEEERMILVKSTEKEIEELSAAVQALTWDKGCLEGKIVELTQNAVKEKDDLVAQYEGTFKGIQKQVLNLQEKSDSKHAELNEVIKFKANLQKTVEHLQNELLFIQEQNRTREFLLREQEKENCRELERSQIAEKQASLNCGLLLKQQKNWEHEREQLEEMLKEKEESSQHHVHDLREKLRLSVLTIAETKQQLTERKERCVELEEQLSESERHRSDLEQQLVEGNQHWTVLDEQLSQNKQQCTELDVELTETKEKLVASQRHCIALESRLTENEERVNEMESLLVANKDMCSSFETKYGGVQEQLASQNEQLITLERHLFESKEQCNEFEEQLAVSKKQCSGLEEHCTGLEEQLADSEGHCLATEEQATLSSKQCMLLQEELDEFKQQCVVTEKLLCESKQEYIALQEELTAKNQLYSVIEKQTAQSAQSSNVLQEALDETQRQLSLVKEELTGSKQCCVDLKDELVENAEKRTKLEQKCSTLEQHLSDNTTRYNAVREQLTESTQYCTELREHCAATEEDLNESSALCRKLQEELRDRNSQLEALTIANAEEAEDSIWKEKYETLYRKVLPFQDQLEQFEAERQLLLGKTQESQKEMDKLGRDYAKLLGHQNQKQKIHHILKLKEENNTLKMEVAKLREQTSRQKRQFGKLEEQLRAVEGKSRFDTKKAFQHSKENNPVTPLQDGNRR